MACKSYVQTVNTPNVKSKYRIIYGDSSTTLPTAGIESGSLFYNIDTGEIKMFKNTDDLTGSWIIQ